MASEAKRMKVDGNGQSVRNSQNPRNVRKSKVSIGSQQSQDVTHRLFVNRSLNMSKIKYVGFDMDYTLAMYKSPQFEDLGFKLTKERLVKVGYPAAILDFEYDPTFAVRGLWFDRKFGNLLKVDSFGNIMVAIHGFHFLTTAEIKRTYPNNFVKHDENISILNTLFQLPEIYLLACVVQYFTDEEDYLCMPEGVKQGDLYIPWCSIHSDIREAVDWVHLKAVMKFMLEDEKSSPNWKSYFDYIMVDARKPLFFSAGTALRQIDEKNGTLCLGVHTGRMEKHTVYAGGSSDMFSEMVGSRGPDVMYVGDHIFGDILKSKKNRGWRTFLVVPELARELNVWLTKSNVFDKLEGLDEQLSELYRNSDSPSKTDIIQLQKTIRETSLQMDQCYGKVGSLFRSGSRMTFFATQVMRYADLYSSTFLNLLHYPLCYMFRAPPMLMPHESTAAHAEAPETPTGSTTGPQAPMLRQDTRLHHNRPLSPDQKAYYFDGDDDGSESSTENDTQA